jgi:transposase-like protein
MKTSLNGVASATTPQERAKILEAFDRSGLSGAAFARQHRIKYTTFCFWRQQRDKTKSSLTFAQVELATTPEPIEVLVELGSQARVRLCSAAQISLVAGLVRELNASRPC